MSKAPISRALESFPKLYYYVPPLPSRLPVGRKSVSVKAPRDAILWLLEALANDSKKSYCLQGQLLDLIRRCHPGMTPSRFSRLTTDMKKNGLVTKKEDGADPRHNRLALTKKGRIVLNAIKAHRRKNVVTFLFEGLTPKEQQELARSLVNIANRFWPKIKEAIHHT